jgi:hypothetical protein
MKWPKLTGGLGVFLFWIGVFVLFALLKIFVFKGN